MRQNGKKLTDDILNFRDTKSAGKKKSQMKRLHFPLEMQDYKESKISRWKGGKDSILGLLN